MTDVNCTYDNKHYDKINIQLAIYFHFLLEIVIWSRQGSDKQKNVSLGGLTNVYFVIYELKRKKKIHWAKKICQHLNCLLIFTGSPSLEMFDKRILFAASLTLE